MRSTWKTRSRNELFALGVGLCVLFLAATIWEVQAACDPRNNCASCSGDGRCTTCRAGYGYQSLTGQCEPCGTDCLECSPIGGNCTKCTVGQGVNFRSGNGSCGPCIQDNCDAGCDVHGAGTCDTCNDGYGPNPSTTNCSECIEHCVSCPVKTSECESCEFGYGIFDPGNQSCGACSTHCTLKGCFRKGPGTCDKCDPGYELFRNNFSCGACAANCTSCPVNGASQCDNCTLGYGLTPTNTCAPCVNDCRSCVTNLTYCDSCNSGYYWFPGVNACFPLITEGHPCGSNCVNCTYQGSCRSCEAGFGPILDLIGQCGPCSQSPGCSGVCDKNGDSKCDACKPGYRLDNADCTLCSPNCKAGCNITGASKCDACDPGYGFAATGSCAPCSPNCTTFGCAANGAGNCDRCDFGFVTTSNNNCISVQTTIGVSTVGESSRPLLETIRSVVYVWTTAMTTSATLDQRVSTLGGDVTCPMLEVGLGLGVPCGFIIIVLLTIIIVFCVQNRSLREYKKKSQDSRQILAMDSTISNAAPQPTSTQYQQLRMQDTQRDYERIEDRYDTISTADTEIRVISDTVNHVSRRATLLPSEEDRYDTVSTADTEITGRYETPIN